MPIRPLTFLYAIPTFAVHARTYQGATEKSMSAHFYNEHAPEFKHIVIWISKFTCTGCGSLEKIRSGRKEPILHGRSMTYKGMLVLRSESLLIAKVHCLANF